MMIVGIIVIIFLGVVDSYVCVESFKCSDRIIEIVKLYSVV